MSRAELSFFPDNAAWGLDAASFIARSSSADFQLQQERDGIVKNAYRHFFDQIRDLRPDIEAEVPRSTEDLKASSGLTVVAFEGNNPRLNLPLQSKKYPTSGWQFSPSSGHKWEVSIRGYKRDRGSSNPGYYDLYTDEQASVILNREGKELNRIIMHLQLAHKKNSDVYIPTMQVEHPVEALSTTNNKGGLVRPVRSPFEGMTSLELIVMANSLAQIYRDGSQQPSEQ